MSRHSLLILVLLCASLAHPATAQNENYELLSQGFAGEMYFAEVGITSTGFDRSNLTAILRSFRTHASPICITFVTSSKSKMVLFQGKVTATPMGYQDWSSRYRELGSRYKGPIAQVLANSVGTTFRIWSKELGLREWTEGPANPYDQSVLGERFDILWLTPIRRMTDGSIKTVADVYVRVEGSLTQKRANIIRRALDKQFGTNGYLLVHLREDGWFQASNDYPNRNPFDWELRTPDLDEVQKSPEFYCSWGSANCEIR